MTTWISLSQAAALTGLPAKRAEYAAGIGRIRRRPAQGMRPTLDRESVEKWAAWYRARNEQRKLDSHKPRASRPPLPPGEWLSSSEAAELLKVTTTTVHRHAAGGLLEVHRHGTQIWVTESSVRELAVERGRWVSWRVASELLGCARDDIPTLIKAGHLEQRPVHRTRPSLSRASIEAYAPLYAQQVADKEAAARRRREEREQARAARRAAPPSDGDVWLNIETTALVLGLSTSRVQQMVTAEQLPAIHIRHRWWLRRSDVEQAAAARAFDQRRNPKQREITGAGQRQPDRS